MSVREVVLGLHVGLNSSVAVIDAATGAPIYAEQEERFSRQKNHCGFPTRALRAAARHATAAGCSIEAVGVGGRTVFPHDMTRSQLLDAYRSAYADQLVDRRPLDRSGDGEGARQFVGDQVVDVLGANCPVEFHDHHAGHAAAAYYFLRPDDDPWLVMTLDGEGDGFAGSAWTAAAGRMERIASTVSDASAGLLYFWVTYLLGLTPHEDEHKIMGLAGYRDRTLAIADAERLFGGLLDVGEDTLTLHVPLDSASTPWMRRLTDRCRRVRFDHLAAAVQAHVEQLALRLVEAAVAKTGISRVLLSGGLFMNVKINQAVRRSPAVSALDVMPSSGDESLALGAAYLTAQRLAGPVPVGTADRTLFLGSDLTPTDLRSAVERAQASGCRVTATGDSALDAAADALRRGQPVAVCTGRAEFGARALGHRSLVAHPGLTAGVERLNATIKQRDFWMPFAPALLDSHASNLLTDYAGDPSRHMMHAYDAARDDRLRGAVHPGDWTCRPQMVADTSDEPLAGLLRRHAHAGELPVLVNTSLNVHGSPIVRTATEAVELLCSTPLRYLLLGDRLLEEPI